jgi:zinc protease
MFRPFRLAVLAAFSLGLASCAGSGDHGFSLPHVQIPVLAPASRTATLGPVPTGPSEKVWPQSYAADLPPDPAMRFGTLPNGLRYVVMHNATPPGQSSLRLRIGAGSLEETDAQQGLAHFLEHMAFDGSTHVPNGEMIKILERHGLAFGADTNASTSWADTEYKLDLPKSDDDTVDSSLMLLREVASELTIEPSAIDKERGVVLSEERLRDTPGYRVLKQNLQFLLQDQLAARRFPIGKVDIIQGANHALIDDFYRKYYRPDDAVVIAVGDFDPDAMEAKIKARFGDWTAKGPAGPDPDLGAPLRRGVTTNLIVEPGAAEDAQLSWIALPDRSPDSKARRRREVINQIAFAILNRRLERLVRADDPPFTSAAAYRADMFHSAEVSTIQATAHPGDWKSALAAIDQEERRLTQYGVSADEIANEADSLRAQRREAAQGEGSRTTPAVAEDIVGTLATPEVETSPTEDLVLFDEDIKSLTPAELNATIKEAFAGSGPLVTVTTPAPIDGGDDAVRTAFAQIAGQPVAAPKAGAMLAWPYDSFGAPGVVAERKDIDDLDTVFIRFENGVRLTVKPTKFVTGEILVQARVGAGELDLPPDRLTTAWAAGSVMPEAGLGKISAQDTDQVLRSKIVGREFTVADNAFVFSGATRPEDLETQLQLLAASASDPGWRPEAFARMRGAAPTILTQMDATPEGVLNRQLGRLLHSGDARWAIPDAAQIAAQSPAQFKADLGPSLAGGLIEIVIVGDTTVDKAIAAVADTFGALPPRPAPTPPSPAAATVAFPAPAATPIVLTHKGRGDQAIGMVAWPTEDFLSDTQRARTISLLGAVLQLRLTEQLRKAESVTYSPSAGSSASSVFPHYGYLSARVELPPGKLDGFFADVARITADLRAKPVTADELERAKLPAFDDLDKRRHTNAYWLNALAGAQADPREIAAIRTSEPQVQRVTAEDIQKAAQTYLKDDRAWKLEVKPAGAH